MDYNKDLEVFYHSINVDYATYVLRPLSSVWIK